MPNACLRRRITQLAVVCAILAAAPLLAILLPVNTATVPILWATYSPPIGALMTLAFWAGMGSSPIAWRLAGLVGGSAYVAVWLSLSDALAFRDERPMAAIYRQSWTPLLIIALLVFGMFAILRLRLQLSDNVGAMPTRSSNRFQFSVYHLLVVTSVAAVVLALMRGARGSEPADRGIESWQWWAGAALAIVTFFANTAGAACAGLGPQNVVRNSALVLLISALLGAALAFALRHDEVGAWFFAGGVATMVLPTVVILASTLWLRPCGIRLIRHRSTS